MSPLYTTLSRAPFSPSRLFRAMEQGLWYDPSDLTAEKIAWRRNLLTYTEQFDTAAWTKAAGTISANSTTAPDGTLTADLFTESTGNSSHYVLQYAVSGTGRATLTFHVKPNGRTRVRLRSELPQTSNLVTTFDLTGGGSVISGIGTITALANGWYRCTATSAGNGNGASGYHLIQPLGPADAEVYTGDGVSGFYVWGAHLERGTSFTEYQKITDFNSDFLAAYPYHTLFQDADAGIPATKFGDPIGAVFDKRLGVLFGPELVTNGTFSSSGSGWTNPDSAPSATTFVNGTASMYAAPGSSLARLRQALTLPAGTYRVTVEVISVSGSPSGALAVGNATSGDITYGNISLATPGLKSKIVTITGPTLGLAFTAGSASGGTLVVDNVSVRAVLGNTAYQTSAPSRPTVEARVNLLTNTGFAGAAAGTPGTAPTSWPFSFNAGTTAVSGTELTLSATAARQVIQQILTSAGVGSYTMRVKVVSNPNSLTAINILVKGGTATSTEQYQINGVNVASSAVPSAGSILSIIVTVTVAGSINFNTGAGAGGTATGSVTISEPDLRLSSESQYPYQRVNTATDYADVGAPRYLSFDGTDDWMVTNSINFTGTDKMTVWAGVRKLGGASAVQALVELSGSASNPGVFSIFAPRSTPGTYNFLLNGNAAGSLSTSAAYTEPVTNVLSCAFDISQPLLVDEIRPRINGVVPTLATLDAGQAGTGNFGNYPLYIGRRAGTLLTFNGRLYGLIIRGTASNADQIATAESWMNSKTRAY